MSRPKAVVEAKVKAATLTTYLATLAVLAIVEAFLGDPTLIAGLPDWLEPFVAALLPALAAAVGGYQAKHTPRPDLT